MTEKPDKRIARKPADEAGDGPPGDPPTPEAAYEETAANVRALREGAVPHPPEG